MRILRAVTRRFFSDSQKHDARRLTRAYFRSDATIKRDARRLTRGRKWQ